MNRYAVFGDPIDHSLSPWIHEQFGRLVGIAVDYGRVRVPAGTLHAALDRFTAAGGRGANITIPLKTEALALCQRLTPRAARAGAVNTLSWDSATLVGDNTDGIGLIQDLTVNLGVAVGGRQVLLLGAGGAAQGIVGPLLDSGIAGVAIQNRTPARAAALIAHLQDPRVLVPSVGQHYDLVINATAASLTGALPSLPPAALRGAVVYDLVYGARARPFLHYAKAHGAARTIDGLGMLVEQAAESFRGWHGVRPPTAPVIAALRARGLGADH
ncbi:MAG: shikimate dehydrogenase [Acidiferrobacter sp.]